MLIFASFILLIQVIISSSVKVDVEQGTLEGKKLELVTKDGHYLSFKGIPYAAPPLGKLRFKAPEPPSHWEGIRNASEHGSVCIQYDIFENKFIKSSSEDCLFLNVYTPDLTPEKLQAVMFFIHGGGYESDSGNVDNYGPDFLIKQGVVLVTINYRLEVLGFLSLDTIEVPGNAGMKDQVAALKWVKKNIAKFGGDPDNITVFGQSAGGASTILHMASPMSKHLFNRAISMSGVPSCDWSLAYQPRRRAFVLGKQLGLDTNDPNELLEYLQSIPAQKLAGVSPNVLATEEINANVFKMFHFTPVIEKDFHIEQFLTEDPEKLIKDSEIHHNIVIGHTSDEGIGDLVLFEDLFLKTYSLYRELFVPRKIQYKATPDMILNVGDMIYEHYFGIKTITRNTIRELLNYFNDATFNYDIKSYMNMLSSNGNRRVYAYKFSALSERNIYGKIGEKLNLTGASHSDDLAYLFDPKYKNLSLDKNSKEYKMIYQLTELYANFAKHGTPNLSENPLFHWPAYNSTSQSFIELGERLVLQQGLDSGAAVFWDTVYKKIL